MPWTKAKKTVENYNLSQENHLQFQPRHVIQTGVDWRVFPLPFLALFQQEVPHGFK
jgi:hypothetical protein